MTRENIINELTKRGYEAVGITATKNNINLDAIVVSRIGQKSNVRPVLYMRTIQNLSIDEIIAIIEDSVQNILLDEENTVSRLFDTDWIRQHMYVALIRENPDFTGIYRPLYSGNNDSQVRLDTHVNISEYIIARFDDLTADDSCGFVTVTQDILSMAGLSESEAWDEAVRNTVAESKIYNFVYRMLQIMKDLDLDIDDEMKSALENGNDDLPLYICTNDASMRGASAILNTKALKKLADKLHCSKLVCIPSSVHECLVAPYMPFMSVDDLTQMVKEVNTESVDETEQLADNAFIITVN